MYNDTITEFDLLESVRHTAREILEYNTDATDIDDLADAIAESADGLVNVYTYACAQEWLAVGMPTPEDFGLENHPSGDIHKTISYCMYYWYDNKLTLELTELLDARNEARS